MLQLVNCPRDCRSSHGHMLWAFLHTHSPRSTCDLSFAVVAVLSVLLRCTVCPLNSFGRPQARFQVRICSFGHIVPQRPVLGVLLAR